MNTRFLLAVAAFAALTLPAAAQMPQLNMMPELKSRSPEERERDAKIEKAYKESLRNIPDKGPADPWGNMRGSENASSAKPKAVSPKAAVQPKSAN